MIDTGQPASDLAAGTCQQWTPDQLTEDFAVTGFSTPFAVVRRTADRAHGTLRFTHHAAVYCCWQEAT